MADASSVVRWGVTDAQDTTPAEETSRIRRVTSSGFTGSKYICCIRAVAFSSSRVAISSKSGSGSS